MIRTRNALVPRLGTSLMVGLSIAAMLCSGTLLAQAGNDGMQGMLKQKLAAIKASAAANQQRLHHYTWTETSQVTVNGNARPAKVSTCSYGPDGKVRKIPVGGSMETADNGGRSGPLRQRIIAKKTAEMKDYMQQVGQVLKLYMPPDPQKMQKSFQDNKVSLSHGNGRVDMVFKDYAQPGDSMTVDFDASAKKIRTLTVRTYLGTPQDAVDLVVDFATLPDGTNHPSRTVLDAKAKGIQVVNTNSNYRKTAP